MGAGSCRVDGIAILEAPCFEHVLDRMEAEHKRIRHDFPAETACYAGFFVDFVNKAIWAFSCGDCRVGLLQDGSPSWVTPVHSSANWRGEEFTLEHAQSSTRRIVTRTLNSKRFVRPEVIQMDYDPAALWILATDGYWIDRLMLSDAALCLDDASFLQIHAGADGLTVESDCGNLYQVGLLVHDATGDGG
jgi:hypothetical protein